MHVRGQLNNAVPMSKYSCLHLLAGACLSEMKMRLLPKISRILGPHDLLSPDGGKQLRVAGRGGGLKCRIIEKFVRRT